MAKASNSIYPCAAQPCVSLLAPDCTSPSTNSNVDGTPAAPFTLLTTTQGRVGAQPLTFSRQKCLLGQTTNKSQMSCGLILPLAAQDTPENSVATPCALQKHNPAPPLSTNSSVEVHCLIFGGRYEITGIYVLLEFRTGINVCIYVFNYFY